GFKQVSRLVGSEPQSSRYCNRRNESHRLSDRRLHGDGEKRLRVGSAKPTDEGGQNTGRAARGDRSGRFGKGVAGQSIRARTRRSHRVKKSELEATDPVAIVATQ